MAKAVLGKSAGGLKPLSLVTFFAAAKKVTAAPHRGNTCAARRIADAGEEAQTQRKRQRNRQKPTP
jgi:hypothetical protein